MEASIGDPFVLSTYGISQKSSKSGKLQQWSSVDVFATHHKASGSSSSSSEGYVTATVRGDGVHVLDLATLHPIISHTLGPTTTFSCPSITQSEHQGSDHICTTYAAISSSPDIPEEEESQKTIWMWKENLSSSIADRAAQKKKRKSIVLPHTISGIYASDELSSRLIVVSSEEGNLTLVDKELLQIRNTKALNSRVLKYFVLSRQKCSFVPSRNTPASGIVVVSLLVSEESVRVSVLVVDSDDGYTDLGDLSLDLDATNIHTASCSLSGFFSVLLKDGSWNMFEFQSSNDTSSLSLTPLSENLQLSPSLGFTPPSSSSQKTQKTPNSTSILSLGSSHVLLAGLTHQTNEIALLFWDLQFSVLLASRTIPVPASLSEGGGGGGGSISVTLVDGLSSSNVLLVLTPNSPPPPPPSDRRKSQNKSATAAAGAGGVTRSSVFVVPVTVPLVSSIANAMGRAADGEKWVVSVRDGALGVNDAADADAGGVGEGEGGGYDVGRKKVIEEIRVAIEQGRPQNANEVFFEWEKCEGEVEREGESGDKDVDGEVDGTGAGVGAGSGDADVELEGDKKKVDQKGKKPSERPSTPEFGYNFVKDILNVILQPSKPPNTPYSSQVIEYLLQKKVVSAAMVEPGLLAVLRLRNDWKSINIALTAVPDLEEKEIIESLRFVLLRHRHLNLNRSNASDAMQVDSTTTTNETETETETIPSLPSFLTTILRTKTSAIPLRLALKRYIPDVEDVLCVLEVLDSWIAQWAGREVRLLPSNKMMGKNEFGVLVVKSGEGMFRGGGGESDIPSLMQITSFLQSILDTSFINLVQHVPAHRILKKIASQVDPEIKYIDQMAQLRGPLEVFVRAQNKAVRDAKAVSEGVQVPLVDWRQRKKLAHEQAGMAIGLYQLEELVL